MRRRLKGYSHPLTPGGKSQLVGKFPWFFSTSQVVVCYDADPREISKQLPEPYEISATEPAGCTCWFGDWLIIPEGYEDIAVTNPERVQYKECQLQVRCQVNAVEGRHCPYIWVDTDFALLAGLIMGFPKKLSKVSLSHSKAKLYELNEAFGKVSAGTRFGSLLEALGDRLITGSVKLSRRISPDELPSHLALPIFNTIYFPSGEIDSNRPLIHRLITLKEENVTFGEIWEAEDANLTFAKSALEEHTRIKPVKITGAYYMEMGIRVVGTKLIHEW